jgi:hypothetical protein
MVGIARHERGSMTEAEFWVIIDARTEARAGISSYPTRESAERQIAAWRARDARGGRPDIHELMPHLEARHGRWPSPGNMKG